MNDIPWTQKTVPPLDPILQRKRVEEIKGQFWPTGLHQDITGMIGNVGNLCNALQRGDIAWGELVKEANETLVPYQQWWHHYTDGICNLSGVEYGNILMSFEDTKVRIEAFDSLVRDIKDLIGQYSATDFPEKLEVFLEAFYDTCDQIEIVIGRRMIKVPVVIRNVRDHVEYLLDVTSGL